MADRSDFGRIFRRRRGDGKFVSIKNKGKGRREKEQALRPGYYIRVRMGGREVIRKAGATKAEAISFLAKLQTEISRAEALGIEPVEEIRFKDYAKAYLEYAKRAHSPSTHANERAKVLSHLVPHFGDRYLSAITGRDVERFLT